MPKVEFKYNLFRDALNITRVLTEPMVYGVKNKQRALRGIPESLVSEFQAETDQFKRQILIIDHLFPFLTEKSDFVKDKIEIFSENWNPINDIYFQRLEKILNVKIPENSIYSAYITNTGSCPYDASQNWFMVTMMDKKVDVIVAHEIMHIEFHHAYTYGAIRNKNKNITMKQYGDFKESLTVLLNEEMSDILSNPDKGYPEHQDLREQISKLWRENKDFNYILKNVIEINN